MLIVDKCKIISNVFLSGKKSIENLEFDEIRGDKTVITLKASSEKQINQLEKYLEK